ncbi:hypothetical protein, partial [Microseira wollei]|uniref:hypothetical protein n=1 Tax=Microseira wollei TaxID=467598 RepID=UPI001CFD9DDB
NMSGNTFPAFGARRSTIFGKNQKLLHAVPLRGRVYLRVSQTWNMSGNTFPAFGARRSTIFGKNQKLLHAVPLRGRVYLRVSQT